jgi:hypothetical protein
VVFFFFIDTDFMTWSFDSTISVQYLCVTPTVEKVRGLTPNEEEIVMKKKLIGMTLVFSAIAFVFALPGCGGEIDSDSDEISQAATTSPYQEV